jgi:hypothetical protein
MTDTDYEYDDDIEDEDDLDYEDDEGPDLSEDEWLESFVANVAAEEDKRGVRFTNRELEVLYRHADQTNTFDPGLVKHVDLSSQDDRVGYAARILEDEQSDDGVITDKLREFSDVAEPAQQ